MSHQNQVISRRMQLHEEIRIIYVVDGYEAIFETENGRSIRRHGPEPLVVLYNLIEAMALMPEKPGGGLRDGSYKEPV